MSKTLIISNRLPVSIEINDNKIIATPSVGGLTTGMQSIHQESDSLWIGWTGLVEEDIDPQHESLLTEALKKEKYAAVSLSQLDIESYYFGFSNRTIWPLFHYFTEFSEFEIVHWQAYECVNHKFAEVVLKHLEPGDKVWIHDYQLMLLPKLIREERPDVSIGFFLHIPFPSFEVFRNLPWRKEILEGLLGADLLGFHTYNYERHFLSSVRRLLGYEINFNAINLENRVVKADTFPMGIDYDKFSEKAKEHSQRSIKDKSEIQREIDKYLLTNPEVKLILSIDRLDYTKGIANRLLAFEHFLEKYPVFRTKVTLVMLTVPSRSNVPQYQLMKSEVDQQVGRINGKYSTVNWTPVWYFYRSMPFDNLIDLYTSSEISLILPIRDGMNLVAKEYIASRVDGKGVLILSEMAGAAQEMSESIIVNPNNMEEIADALKDAFTMPEEEQRSRNLVLQARLKRYNIVKWADDFMSSLEKASENQKLFNSKKLNIDLKEQIISQYRVAKKRVLFLDYDGTLVGFKSKPELASPDEELYTILDTLAADKHNEVVLISGRDRDTFDEWFRDKSYTFIVEHGVWSRMPDTNWSLIEPMHNEWKDMIRPILELYMDRTPGSLLEEKNYSLVWHYRKADPELGSLRANELKDELTSFIANHNLEIMEGNKVIEVKNAGVNKGKAAFKKINENQFDFIMGIGDDWTDEYLFGELPSGAVTIKVGLQNTKAKYNVEAFGHVRELLVELGRKFKPKAKS
jgi:trehalose 6-phosphate synthase/phosphatase